MGLSKERENKDMNDEYSYMSQLETLCQLFTAKGYRGLFQLCQEEYSQRKGPVLRLKEALISAMAEAADKGKDSNELFLSYEFYSGIHKDQVECRFCMAYNINDGFSVSSMRMELKDRDDTKSFRFRNNEEIPGYQSLEGHFNKRPPWDDYKRGRFR